MASGDSELVRLYLNRLVGSLAPAQLGTEYAYGLVDGLTTQITRPSSSATDSVRPLLQYFEEFKRLFLSRNRSDDWRSFQAIIEALTSKNLKNLSEEFTRNLVALSRLTPASHRPSKIEQMRFPQSAFESDRTSRHSSLFPSSPHPNMPSMNATMHQLIGPYYKTLEDQELLVALRHTLVGQDTKLLRYLRDQHSIAIPVSVNTSYTQLLTDILEPALLAKSLHMFLESRRGSKNSPIKTAFLSFVEAYLMHYADFIEGVFRTTPTSLSALLDSLDGQIPHLRFLGHLKARLVDLNGFDFLLEVCKFSHFGDQTVFEFASSLFGQISAPYYQYFEHWLIKGELIDESDEFFVSFDNKENHINDIIKYNAKKLPTFMKLDEEIFTKSFQLGKTLVFLEKYCMEFDWVNDFARRYHLFIFTAHNGLQLMDPNTLQVIIDRQYDEALKYYMLVVQSKYLLFTHLLSMKRVMLMESGDFIDAIEAKGAEMFGKLALSLTSARLSELLADSIDLSSLRVVPPNYQRRVDARILDLGHGTIGWDVFTLDYSIPEPPLEALLNYRDQSTQYLRLFNFLWGLRHYQYLLRENFLQFQDYCKRDLRLIKAKLKSTRGPASKYTERRLKWLAQALRVVSLVRYRISMLVDAILNFVSFDLIEDSFREHIVQKLFTTSTSKVTELKKGILGEASRLSIVDSAFLQERNELLLLIGLESSTPAELNTADLTIDELTATHAKYLQGVSDCKLLREDVRGRHTGRPFVHQIFELLELAFAFLSSSGEFGTTLSTYFSLLQLRSESFDFDEDWDDFHNRLNAVKTFIQTELFADRFQSWLKEFVHDMRSEAELKELSKMI